MLYHLSGLTALQRLDAYVSEEGCCKITMDTLKQLRQDLLQGADPKPPEVRRISQLHHCRCPCRPM